MADATALEISDTISQPPGRLDLCSHLRDDFLNQLMTPDGLPELDSLFGIIDARFETALSKPYRTRSEEQPSCIDASQSIPQCAACLSDLVFQG